jgi:hypothetical protein
VTWHVVIELDMPFDVEIGGKVITADDMKIKIGFDTEKAARGAMADIVMGVVHTSEGTDGQFRRVVQGEVIRDDPPAGRALGGPGQDDRAGHPGPRALPG